MRIVFGKTATARCVKNFLRVKSFSSLDCCFCFHMDPIAGSTQKDNEFLPPNSITVLNDRRQDENVGTSAGTGNTSLPLSRQDIPEIVAAVMAAAFPKAKTLPEDQYTTSQPVTGEFQ